MSRRTAAQRGLIAIGAAVIVLSPVAGAAPVPPSGTLDLAVDADVRLAGADAGDGAGWSVARAGDVNGDGSPDLLVGAPTADPRGREDAGAAYVVLGPAAGLPTDLGRLAARGFRIDGAVPGARAGTAVAAAGDVDGDGFTDVLVGAPAWSDSDLANGTGAAYLVRGGAALGDVDLAVPGAAVRLATGIPDDHTGMAVGSVPDMDGDRRAELLVGAPRADAAFVVFAASVRGDVDLANADIRLDGPAGSRAGVALAGVPDMNGDGRGELAIGAPTFAAAGGRPAGRGYVVFGRAERGRVDLGALGGGGFPVLPAESDGHLGLGVAAVGDITGDGRPDVAFGAPESDRNRRAQSGSVHVIAGQATAEPVRAGDPDRAGMRLDGAAPDDRLGGGLSGAGDANADGRPDLAASALFANALSRPKAGAVYVVYGAAVPAGDDENAGGGRGDPATTIVDLASLGDAGHRLAGPGDGARLYAVAAAGDLDGNGTEDLIAGAPHAARGARDAAPRPGTAYVVLTPPPAEPPPPDPGVEEEEQAGCSAADNVEMLIDDSGSMADSDPQLLRRRAIELVLSKPRNEGEVLGAYEFGSVGTQLFEPQEIRPRGPGSNQPELFELLERRIEADNGGTNYNEAFVGVANDNPAAEARIFLTDGEHNEGRYRLGHRGGPPTYVIGLNIGGEGEAAERLARIAEDTGGRYFPSVTAQQLQAVLNRVDSRLNCDVESDGAIDVLTEDDPIDDHSTWLRRSAHAYDVEVSWGDDADRVVPERLELIERGRAVAVIGSARLGEVLRRPGRTFRFGGARIRGRRRDTFFGVRISGERSDRLRVRYRMTRFEGRGARVTAQILQSRRRR
jgi:FG-GAP repeat